MAKRRTREQIDADQVIKAQLNELGEKIYQQAQRKSRVARDQYYKTDRVQPKGSLRKAGGTLRDSVNYMVQPDTTLTVAQVYYGEYQSPNELEVAIEENVDESIDLIVTRITGLILRDYDI